MNTPIGPEASSAQRRNDFGAGAAASPVSALAAALASPLPASWALAPGTGADARRTSQASVTTAHARVVPAGDSFSFDIGAISVDDRVRAPQTQMSARLATLSTPGAD